MKKGIIGKKIGMTQIFDEKGRVIPVTVIEAGPCVVTQKKTEENDGYNAVQIGFGDQKPQRVSKPLTGHFKKGDVAPKKTLRELRLDDISALNVGDLIKADAFEAGEKVDVTGKSKGKGYAGVIKRWNFRRRKETHGSGPVARHGGSNGACSTPSRVWKGLKMAGHLGAETVTVQNLTVAKVDAENNLIAVKGAIPGPNGGIVVVRDSVKASGKEETSMPSIAVLNMQGKEVGQQELSEAVFGIEPNVSVMNDMVKNYLANQRQGTQSALTRSEVSGGGKKPWRQKGTGRARQGSTRAPQWTHGGIVFAPKPREYRYTLNKKVRRLAMKSALSSKVRDNEMIVIDQITADSYKTKTIADMLKAVGSEKKALIVLSTMDEKVIASARNIPGVKTAQVNTLNVYDILGADKFIVVKDAVAKIEEVYA